jgi:hypothetical protein
MGTGQVVKVMDFGEVRKSDKEDIVVEHDECGLAIVSSQGVDSKPLSAVNDGGGKWFQQI